MKSEKLVSAVVLALGLIGLGWMVKAGIDNFISRDRTVTVRGLCEKEIPANKVTWPIVSEVKVNTIPEAFTASENSNAVVVAFLKANGLSEKEISVNAPQLSTRENYRNGEVVSTYYVVTNVIVVTSEQVDKVRELILRQGELLKKGIAIRADDWEYSTSYEYTDLNSIKPEMIAEATAKAREAANKFAEDSGSKIGRLESAQQGQFTIEDRDKFTPFIKNVRVVTTLTYSIDN